MFYITKSSILTLKIFPSCPEDNNLKRRTGRIQRITRPHHPTARINQPGMGGMGRARDNNYH